MKIIDAHAHIYPHKIAPAAVSSVARFYGIPFHEAKGTAEDLLMLGERVNVTNYAVLGVATTEKQVKSINNFIAKSVEEHKEFIGFATLHPDMSENAALDEIERFKSLNLSGLKFHPDFQKFNIDDEKMFAIYRRCQELDIPILFHAGDDRYDFSAPARLAKVARRFNNLRIIGAHFGGYSRWGEIGVYEGLSNVFFDTSSSLFTLPKETAVRIILNHGHSQFMFGSDYPMWRPDEELTRFLKLDLTPREQEDILYNNAASFFKLDKQ